MRKIQYLLITIAALLLSTGCTSFQAKEAGRGIAGGLFEMALDIALDGPERRARERQRWEDNPANRWSVCPSPCDIGYDQPTKAELEEEARRTRERETRHYQEEVNSIIDALEEAEQRSGELEPESATTDYEQQEEERLLQREETLQDQAEFDEFMRELETAEEQNNDPRLTRITGE